MDRLPKNQNPNFLEGFEMDGAAHIRGAGVINLNPSVEERLGILPLERATTVGAVNSAEPPVTTSISQTLQFGISELEYLNVVASTVSSSTISASTINAGSINFAGASIVSSTSQTLQFGMSELEHLNAAAGTVNANTINAGATSFAELSVIGSTQTVQFERSELEHLNVTLNAATFLQPVQQAHPQVVVMADITLNAVVLPQPIQQEQPLFVVMPGVGVTLTPNFDGNFNTMLHQGARIVCGANQYVAEGNITIIRQLTTSQSGAMRLELSTGEIELIGEMSLGDFGG